MPRYYCDYCDTYLTHDSPSVREATQCRVQAQGSISGNVRVYYQQYEAQQNQYLIDQKVKEHLGQAAAFQQVGAAYNQLRPRLPMMPMPGMNPYLMPGMRPPISLPRPLPGYPGMPQMLTPPGAPSIPGQGNPSIPGQGPSMPGQGNPSMPGQGNPSMPGQGNPSMPGQGNPSMPGQVNNGVPRPMSLNPHMMAPGSSGTPTSGAPPMFTPNMYQANPSLPPPPSGGFENSNANSRSQDADH